MSKLTFTTEIGGSYLSHSISSENYNELLANPASYIKAHFNVELPNTQVKTVQNQNNEVNITLPYYSQLDRTASAAMTEDDLETVAGGEILISLAVLTASAGVTAGIAAGAVAGIESTQGRNIDGSKK